MKLRHRKPPKLKLLVAFDTVVGARLVEEPGYLRELNPKIQTNLVIGFACVLEEVLDDVEQVRTFNALAQFLHHLAHERALPIFAWLNASAWKSPVLITFQTMQQDETIVDNNGRSAKLKTMADDFYGDHRCALRLISSSR